MVAPCATHQQSEFIDAVALSERREAFVPWSLENALLVLFPLVKHLPRELTAELTIHRIVVAAAPAPLRALGINTQVPIEEVHAAQYTIPAGAKPSEAQALLHRVAVLLFELLAGRSPFEGASARGIEIRKRLERAPSLQQFRPDLSPTVAKLITLALDRPSAQNASFSAKDLLEALLVLVPFEAQSHVQSATPHAPLELSPLSRPASTGSFPVIQEQPRLSAAYAAPAPSAPASAGPPMAASMEASPKSSSAIGLALALVLLAAIVGGASMFFLRAGPPHRIDPDPSTPAQTPRRPFNWLLLLPLAVLPIGVWLARRAQLFDQPTDEPSESVTTSTTETDGITAAKKRVEPVAEASARPAPRTEQIAQTASIALPATTPQGSWICSKCSREYTDDYCFCTVDGTDSMVSGETLPSASSANKKPARDTIFETFSIGSYQCTALLGEGGMGVVYRARHTKLKRECAIKVLLPDQRANNDASERFQAEAELAASIQHPNTVLIYDFGELDGMLYLVMELIDGKPLSELLANGTLPLARATSLAAQLCDGLEALHKAGIVHRDLKPQNVMVIERPDRPDTLKIVDFGLARTLAAAQSESSGRIEGTPLYMAPEQARGEQELDPRSDVFALSVVVFELLTARFPFEFQRKTALQLLRERASMSYRLLSLRDVRPEAHYPEAVDALLREGLAPTPAQRPASVTLFRQRLTAALSAANASSSSSAVV